MVQSLEEASFTFRKPRVMFEYQTTKKFVRQYVLDASNINRCYLPLCLNRSVHGMYCDIHFRPKQRSMELKITMERRLIFKV